MHGKYIQYSVPELYHHPLCHQVCPLLHIPSALVLVKAGLVYHQDCYYGLDARLTMSSSSSTFQLTCPQLNSFLRGNKLSYSSPCVWHRVNVEWMDKSPILQTWFSYHLLYKYPMKCAELTIRGSRIALSHKNTTPTNVSLFKSNMPAFWITEWFMKRGRGKGPAIALGLRKRSHTDYISL